jgi:3-oxoacyl-[acyl-carrier protein] reductase
MDYGLKGKNAVITGASSGLGHAIAETFAAEGANLLTFARRAALLEKHAEGLRSRYGVTVETVAGDMRDRESIARLAEAADAMPGGPDVLILNTGRPPGKMQEVLDERDDERWETAYRVQLWGGVQIVQAIAPRLVAKGWGRIVAVTSASVKQPMLKHGLSTVFRAGMTGFLKHLSNEIAASGVTVNMVCPGSIATEGLRENYDIEARAASLPVKRVGKPEELAATVAFFASDKAGFTTGASLQVDGGQNLALC